MFHIYIDASLGTQRCTVDPHNLESQNQTKNIPVAFPSSQINI